MLLSWPFSWISKRELYNIDLQERETEEDNVDEEKKSKNYVIELNKWKMCKQQYKN